MKIKNAIALITKQIEVYFTGSIPVASQRPIYVIGAPGIGKTQMMTQIAQQLGAMLVKYDLKSLVRSTAPGLPTLVQQEYDGISYQATQYTLPPIMNKVLMSKALAKDIAARVESVHSDRIILFLDELNCVSESIQGLLLDFLQSKELGDYKLPKGVVIVAAGNPEQYNDAARSFDAAVNDRLAKYVVETDPEQWLEYANTVGVAQAVVTFLEWHKDYLLKIERDVNGSGTNCVTPRAWTDLSLLIKALEKDEFPVTLDVIAPYIQDPQLAREFASYYELYKKYRATYNVGDIMAGKFPTVEVKEAPIDERFSLLALLTDGAMAETQKISESRKALEGYVNFLKQIRVSGASASPEQLRQIVTDEVAKMESEIAKLQEANMITPTEVETRKSVISTVLQLVDKMMEVDPSKKGAKIGYPFLVDQYRELNEKLYKVSGPRVKEKLNNLFSFIEQVFGEQELLVFVTAMTANNDTSDFIKTFGCEGYFRHCNALQVTARSQKIAQELTEIADELLGEPGEPVQMQMLA